MDEIFFHKVINKINQKQYILFYVQIIFLYIQFKYLKSFSFCNPIHGSMESQTLLAFNKTLCVRRKNLCTIDYGTTLSNHSFS